MRSAISCASRCCRDSASPLIEGLAFDVLIAD
jgi:hypothetical protein